LGDGVLGTVSPATTVTVTGAGFPPEQDDISLRIAPSGVPITPTAGQPLTMTRRSIDGTTSGLVRADALGGWRATFSVPQLEAGEYNIFAVYTPVGGAPTTSEPAGFTVTAEMLVIEEATLASRGVYNSRVRILLTGFRGGESITLIPTNFLRTEPFDGGDPFTGFTVATDPTYGGGSTIGLTGNAGFIASRPGGTFSVIAFGASSGISLTKSFTVDSTLAFTWERDFPLRHTLSLQRTATTFFVHGLNWPVTTPATVIPANDLKLVAPDRTITTSHAAITVDSTGRFTNIAVTYFDDLPTVPLKVQLFGREFSLENGNIIPVEPLRAALLANFFPMQGALVASDPARPDLTFVSPTTVRHFAGDLTPLQLVLVFGINGAPNAAWGVNWDGAAAGVAGVTTTDAHGAGLAIITLIPAGGARAFGDHTLTFTGALSDAGAQIISVRPFVGSLGTRGYRETFPVSGHGFVPGEPIDVSVAGRPWFTVPGTSVGADGSFSVTSGPLPALPWGSPPVAFTGVTDGNTFTRTVTIRPVVIRDPALTPPEPLTTNTAGVGDPVILRSAVTLGVFGLFPGRVHDVVVGGVKVTSFTSTADGSIPGAISFTVPALRGGLHIVDIIDTVTGRSAIFGLTRYTGDQFSSRVPPGFGSPGPGLRLTVSIRLTLSPNSGSPGTVVTISGAGLAPATKYFVTISSSSTALAGPWQGFTLAEFTSTAAGEVPAGTKVTIPDLPNPVEVGTAWYIHASTAGQLAALTSTGSGPFLASASATLKPSEGDAGTSVDITARGLTANRLYLVYFGFVNPDNPGIAVGSLVSDAFGRATATFTVPSLAAGTYRIQLFDTVDNNFAVFNIPPTFTLKAVAAVAVFDSTTFKASAKTDKPSYKVGEEFKVSFLLKTTTGSAKFDYVVTVKDPDGRVLYPISAATGISVDTTGTTITVTYAVPTGAKAGTWTASIVILQAGAVVEVAVITFTVT
jgi:hypothetical protein